MKNDEKHIEEELLKALAKSKKELADMGIAGQRLIEAKYIWGSFSSKTLKVYEWLTGSGLKPKYVYLQ